MAGGDSISSLDSIRCSSAICNQIYQVGVVINYNNGNKACKNSTRIDNFLMYVA
jgi:hypothetical protein